MSLLFLTSSHSFVGEGVKMRDLFFFFTLKHSLNILLYFFLTLSPSLNKLLFFFLTLSPSLNKLLFSLLTLSYSSNKLLFFFPTLCHRLNILLLFFHFWVTIWTNCSSSSSYSLWVTVWTYDSFPFSPRKQMKDLFPSQNLEAGPFTLITLAQRTENDMSKWSSQVTWLQYWIAGLGTHQCGIFQCVNIHHLNYFHWLCPPSPLICAEFSG